MLESKLKLEQIPEVCKEYYTSKQLHHAYRVAFKARYMADLYYSCDELIEGEVGRFIELLGLAHDLYEDTTIEQNFCDDQIFEDNLQLLTKKEDMDYNTYVAVIRYKALKDKKFLPAYIVKLADMYDHFAQVDTLTSKLRDKYVAAMPYLL